MKLNKMPREKLKKIIIQMGIKSHINSDQKEGQNWLNHKPEDTIVFLKVRYEFLGIRERRGEKEKKNPPL